MNKKVMYTFIIVITLILASLYILTRNSEKQEEKIVNNNSMNNSEIANPASVHCIEQGYNLTIRTNLDGSQSGYCIFPNGTECEEWKFFRGEC
jgi:putative hemolysin